MKLPQPTSNFEPAPAGTHIGICIMLIDLGTQEDQFGTKRKLRITWELAGTQMEDGRPFTISQDYTFTMNEKANLRKMLISWRGRDFTPEEFQTFDLRAILGAPCMITVTHRTSASGNEYATVASVSKLMQGTQVPQQQNVAICFSFDEPELNVYNELSDWLKEQIAKSPEYQQWRHPQATPPPEVTRNTHPEPITNDESIPF